MTLKLEVGQVIYIPGAADIRNETTDQPEQKPMSKEEKVLEYHYSIPYYTDCVSQTSQEMGIDNRYKEQLAQYTKFWKNKNNIEKFKKLGIDNFNQQMIDIGLIAVLVDVKTPNFEEIVKKLILNDSTKYMKALEDYLRYDGDCWREDKQLAVGVTEEFLDLQLADAEDAVEAAVKALVTAGVDEVTARAGGKDLEKLW